jgi:hypothetical protein
VIYGPTGDVVTIARRAVLADVQLLAGRKPDKQDRECLANDSYIVVRQDDGKERLFLLAYLRADGGSLEITAAIDALPAATPDPLPLPEKKTPTTKRNRR